MKKQLVGNAEFYLFCGMALFSLFVLWQSVVIDVEESRLIPLVIFLLAAGSTALQGWAVFYKRTCSEGKQVLLRKKEWAAFLALLASYWGYQCLGFYTTSFLVLMAVSLLVQERLTVKTALSVLAFDAGFLLITYLCFGVLLKLSTPAGLLI